MYRESEKTPMQDFHAVDTLRGQFAAVGESGRFSYLGPPFTASIFTKQQVSRGNTTGRFPVSFPAAGHYNGEARARGTDGGLTPGVLSKVFEVASLDPGISVLISWRFMLNDSVRFETRVVDDQGDLTGVIWDFNGDGTVDFRSAPLPGGPSSRMSWAKRTASYFASRRRGISRSGRWNSTLPPGCPRTAAPRAPGCGRVWFCPPGAGRTLNWCGARPRPHPFYWEPPGSCPPPSP